MRIGFISYDANHLKTEQVISQWALSASGEDIQSSQLYLVPFKPRAAREPIFKHRPVQSEGVHTEAIAKSIGLSCERCSEPSEIPLGMDVYVVLGVGLLPDEFVQNNIVINAHPGIIPRSRGLDSFKWAIFEQERVGVTLHRLSEDVDMGDIWITQATPVCVDDSLESFARRHYELEIDLLSRFKDFIEVPGTPADESTALPATKRMPKEKETELWNAFKEYKRIFV